MRNTKISIALLIGLVVILGLNGCGLDRIFEPSYDNNFLLLWDGDTEGKTYEPFTCIDLNATGHPGRLLIKAKVYKDAGWQLIEHRIVIDDKISIGIPNLDGKRKDYYEIQNDHTGSRQEIVLKARFLHKGATPDQDVYSPWIETYYTVYHNPYRAE